MALKLSVSTGANMNYVAKVVKIRALRPHSNADRLLVTTIDGNNLITAKGGIQEGDLVVVFPLECAISHVLLGPTNSYKHSVLNADVNKTGFFEDSGRVKALRLRGERSEGYMLPTAAVAAAFGIEDTFAAHEGVEFDTINGVTFVKKYIIKKPKDDNGPGVKNAPGPKRELLEAKLIDNQFRFHNDTSHLGKNMHRLSPTTEISVTWKLHGTSGVFSNIMVKKKLTRLERLLKWFGVKIVDTEYDMIFSSRKVIKNSELSLASKSYYDGDLWSAVNEELKGSLLKGETLYVEICGYTPSGQMIQKGYDFFKTPFELKPYEVYVYRITHTNVDGKVVELSHLQLEERCLEIGIKSVPLVFTGTAKNLFPFTGDLENPRDISDWRENFLEFLKKTFVYDQDTAFSKNKVPEEGVIVRIEKNRPESLKLKSFKFAEQESKQLDAGEVSIEDTESNPSE